MRSLMSPLGHNAQPYRTCKPIVFFIMHAGRRTNTKHASIACSFVHACTHTIVTVRRGTEAPRPSSTRIPGGPPHSASETRLQIDRKHSGRAAAVRAVPSEPRGPGEAERLPTPHLPFLREPIALLPPVRPFYLLLAHLAYACMAPSGGFAEASHLRSRSL